MEAAARLAELAAEGEAAGLGAGDADGEGRGGGGGGGPGLPPLLREALAALAAEGGDASGILALNLALAEGDARERERPLLPSL